MTKSTVNRNQLGSMVQRKGEAVRPVDIHQRGELAPPPAAVQPNVPPAAEKEQTKEELKALTLRLKVKKWRHLRDYAHQEEMSHQQLMEDAVDLYFQTKGKPMPT